MTSEQKKYNIKSNCVACGKKIKGWENFSVRGNFCPQCCFETSQSAKKNKLSVEKVLRGL